MKAKLSKWQTKVCPTCNEEFSVPYYNRDHIYCSKHCSASKNSVTLSCEFCGKEFKTSPSRVGVKKFCSYSCRSNRTQAIKHNMTNQEWLDNKETYYETFIASRKLSTYKTARRKAIKRDGNQCVSCGSTDKLNAHHIKPVMLFPELVSDVDNLVTLCNQCHVQLHRQGEVWQQ